MNHESPTTLPACPMMDWEQVCLNGGPPCFFVEPHAPERFCARAERWQGHGVATFHDYVSLEEFAVSRRTASVGADAAAANDNHVSKDYDQGLLDSLEVIQKHRSRWTLSASYDQVEAMVKDIAMKIGQRVSASSSDAAEIVAEMAREAEASVYGVSGWNSFYEGWLAYILGAVRESDDPQWLDGWDVASETRQPELALRDEIKAGHVIVSLPVADALREAGRRIRASKGES